MKSALWICLCLLLTAALRCHNLHDVFLDGQVYFVDGDCYSRMTRAQRVEADPGLIIAHQEFENYPQGVESHTTAPLDYLIVAVRKGVGAVLAVVDPGRVSLLRGQELDVAGALVSPLLGVATALFLALWARRLAWGWAAAFFFALSPILVHGTVLGRPDHQSLLIFTLAVALGAEWRLAQQPSRSWAICSGLAWALSLWVSLYEPAVLLLAVALGWALAAPRRLLVPERWLWLGCFGALCGMALLIDGWRLHAPDPVVRQYFPAWSAMIGELAHAPLPLLLRWLGWLALLTPLLLGLAARAERRVWPMLGLWLLLVALSVWHTRWGYFLALVFAMSLPFQLAVLRRWWLVWPVALVSLWPVAQGWEEQLFPDEPAAMRLAEQAREKVLLRQIATRMRGDGQLRPFLAPWWLSPALVYWSGQPGVTGTSHESLGGTVDAARCYLAASPEESVAILRARGVAWLIADEDARLIETSRYLLGTPGPERPLATLLTTQPHSVAPFIVPVFANDYFKLFAVDAGKFPVDLPAAQSTQPTLQNAPSDPSHE